MKVAAMIRTTREKAEGKAEHGHERRVEEQRSWEMDKWEDFLFGGKGQ